MRSSHRSLRTALALILVCAGSVLAAEGDLIAEQTFGSADADFGYAMQPTSDGGLVLAGRTYGFGADGSDFYVVRLDADATELWSTTVGTIANDGCNGVVETGDGGFVLVGWVDVNSFERRGQAIKLDADGQLVWQRFYLGDEDSDVTFVEDEFEAVIETDGGDLVMAGTANSFGLREPWLVRTDDDGDLIWQAHHPLQGNGKDHLTDVVEMPGGGFAASGWSGDSNTFTDNDPNAIAFSSTGAYLWQRTLADNTPSDYALGIGVGPDGNLAVVGESSIPTLWLLSPGGAILSTTYYDASGRFQDVVATSDGGLLMAGNYQVPDLTFQAWIVKTDADGVLLWDRKFGGSDGEDFSAACERSNGEYALFGTTESLGAGDRDCYLVRVEGPLDVTGAPGTVTRPGITLEACPNPFNPATTLAFTLQGGAAAELGIYDVRGRPVAELHSGYLGAGRHEFRWQGRDAQGAGVASGAYFARLRTGREVRVRRVLLLK